MFSCEFCEISKNTFLQNTFGRLLFTRPILQLIDVRLLTKLFKETNCFLSINWCWTTVSFIFDKNIKIDENLLFSFQCKVYIFMRTIITNYLYFYPWKRKQIFKTPFDGNFWLVHVVINELINVHYSVNH